MPKLSIISVNLNNREGLERTIQSVLSQTFTDFEYIIIDGGSTDGSVELIQSLNPSILQSFSWISEPDTGIYNAMNKGIKLAKGEYLQFLNSGDWHYSNTVLEEVFALNRTEDILYGDIIFHYDKSNQKEFKYPDQITSYYLVYSTICHQAIFNKKSLFDRFNYNETFKIVSDWEFLLKSIVFFNCSIYKINKFLIFFDTNGVSSVIDKSLINQERQKVLNELYPKRILDDYLKLNEVYSLKLYPYILAFSKYPKLQRLVKRFIKYTLLIKNKKMPIFEQYNNFT